ncbi:MAG: metallophosphoesterase [Candidatus Paceibacterota bacterium]|jgi:hypothetical protein
MTLVSTFAKFILFLGVMLAVLGGAHFFVWWSLVRLAGLAASSWRWWLAGGMAALTLTFVIASVLLHTKGDGWGIGIAYAASSIWLGFFVYLFFASILGWVALWIVQALGISLSPRIIMSVLVALAFVYSAWGLYNAQNIAATKITVPIANIPAAWKGKTIVQLSDVHLGAINRVGFAQKIVDLTMTQHPDMIVITGDLFDGTDGNLEEFIASLKQLRAPEGVYFVTGNHEEYLGIDAALEIVAQTGMHILNDQAVDINGAQVVGLQYRSGDTSAAVTSRIEQSAGYQKNMPTILLHHVPEGIDGARDAGVSLELCGHTHQGQLFPFGYVTELLYGKYYHGLSYDGPMAVYTSSGAGTWGPPMRTGNRPEIVSITLQ